MSIKTIAVLKETELKDGQMFVSAIRFVYHPHVSAGKKSLSKVKEKSCCLALEIKSMPPVRFVPTTAHLLPKEY